MEKTFISYHGEELEEDEKEEERGKDEEDYFRNYN
jgi:hypothetical protein